MDICLNILFKALHKRFDIAYFHSNVNQFQIDDRLIISGNYYYQDTMETILEQYYLNSGTIFTKQSILTIEGFSEIKKVKQAKVRSGI